MGPIAHFGETEMLRREIERLQSHLGEAEIPIGDTECVNSVRPVSAISKQRLGQANSVGPIAHLGETKIIATGNREFASPSR